jgi:hypothetical protein
MAVMALPSKNRVRRGLEVKVIVARIRKLWFNE